MLEKVYWAVLNKTIKIRHNYPACLKKEYPDLLPIAENIVTSINTIIKDKDFSSLAKNSPALKNFDWMNYLSCSMIRMIKVADALNKISTQRLNILDLGSYFGNFSLMGAKLGHSIAAIDSYKSYEPVFNEITDLLKAQQIEVNDFSQIGYDLSGFKPDSFDAVLCLGVIEHVPHTPKPLLEAINYALKPGGHLILDTPNLNYVYNHKKLKKGLSIFPPIEQQYHTEIPFVGHHREYSISEIQWMISNLGYKEVALETFFYSIYGLPYLAGEDLFNYYKMKANPKSREIILSVSQKPS